MPCRYCGATITENRGFFVVERLATSKEARERNQVTMAFCDRWCLVKHFVVEELPGAKRRTKG